MLGAALSAPLRALRRSGRPVTKHTVSTTSSHTQEQHFVLLTRRQNITPHIDQANSASSSCSSISSTMAGTASDDAPIGSGDLMVAESDDTAAARHIFAGAMDKETIGALRFLKEYPEYDGRGVVVAIFDTGVDPAAAGLQITSDGKAKILDVVDCTGSGDVDTSRKEKAGADGTILGASGRRLHLHPSWQNPSGEWRVGCKHALDLFSRPLVQRVKEERRKRWDEKQRVAMAAAVEALARFERATAKVSGQDHVKQEKAELKGRIAYLKDTAKNYEDPGPLLDAVVWHDGSTWRAALDTQEMEAEGSGKGRLENFTPLTDYRLEHKYGTFSAMDSCSFALNIYNDGDVLSIVVDAGAHGTHVAGITAAYFPEDPDSNGNAPGAQIISCKIGDSRLGSMETGTGLTRALITVLQHKADLVNMSYGEPTSAPNQGRFIDLATELVHKHGVIFVASGGNAGPALSTVGAPGGTSSAIFGIAAYVGPALAAAGHSLRTPMAEGAGQAYTWSSRGPSPDGHVGIAFCAPGGAIAPVPQWTQQRRMLMNGTSMSSPNACGGLALLLSGLKALGHTASPARVRRGVEATCLPLGGDAPDAILTYGRGMLQVDAAFDYLLRSTDVDKPDVNYDVTVTASDQRDKRRGIYLREAHETLQPAGFTCNVSPKLHEDAPNEDRLKVENLISLEASQPWISCPADLLLHYSGRGFEVVVDGSQLEPGLHYGEVRGFDAEARWRGPLFRLPVTVVRPEQPMVGPPNGGAPGLPMYTISDLQLQPGTEHRRFIAVPEGATWAELLIRSGQHDTPKIYLLRATQLRPGASYRETETRSQVTMGSHGEYVSNLRVIGGATLELTVAQFWSSLGTSQLSVEMAFHGVQLAPGAGGGGSGQGGGLTLDSGARLVLAKAPVRSEKLKPEAKFTALTFLLRPSELGALEPLNGPRDTLPDGRVVYRLLLSYKLAVTEAGKYKPVLPLFNKHIYDGVIEAQFYMLHSSSKQLLASGDAHPEYTQLKKGDYTVRVMLRHDSQELLEKLRSLPLTIKRKLDPPVSLPVYATLRDAVIGGSTADERLLKYGDMAPLYLGPLPDDKLPKDATAGRVLTGKLTLGQVKRGSGAAPTNYHITYVVPPPVEAPKDEPCKDDACAPAAAAGAIDATGAKDAAAAGGVSAEGRALGGSAEAVATTKLPDSNPLEVSLEEAVRDAEIRFLKELKLGDKKQQAMYDALFSRLQARWPSHLPLLSEHLKKLDGADKAARSTPEQLDAIIAAADAVIGAIDTVELACYVAVKFAEDTPAWRKEQEKMNERKAVLLDALSRKCTALLDKEELAAHPPSAPAVPAAGATPPVPSEAPALPLAADEAPSTAEERMTSGSTDTALPAAASDSAAAPAAMAAMPPAAAAATEDSATIGSAKSEFDKAFAQLRKWVDTAADVPYLQLHARAEARAHRYTAALKALDKLLTDDTKAAAEREVHEQRAALLASLGWAHWAAYERDMLHIRFPADFPLF